MQPFLIDFLWSLFQKSRASTTTTAEEFRDFATAYLQNNPPTRLEPFGANLLVSLYDGSQVSLTPTTTNGQASDGALQESIYVPLNGPRAGRPTTGDAGCWNDNVGPGSTVLEPQRDMRQQEGQKNLADLPPLPQRRSPYAIR